jgi:tetratricopeptide (TPR) repeat protein
MNFITRWLKRRAMMQLYGEAQWGMARLGLPDARALASVKRSRAQLSRALVMARELGDLRAQGGLLRALGDSYMTTFGWSRLVKSLADDWRKAIEFYERDVNVAIESEDPDGEFHSRIAIGLLFERLKPSRAEADLEVPVEHLVEAVNLAADLNRDPWRLAAVALLASALLRQGRKQKALEIFNGIVEQLNLSAWSSDERSHLVKVLRSSDRSETAIHTVVSWIGLESGVGDRAESRGGVNYVHHMYFRAALRFRKPQHRRTQ